MAGLGPDDQIVTAGRHSFNKLEDLLAKNGMKLVAGDRIKVYDLSCITVSTATLVRLLTGWLHDGIAFEIASLGIAIEARADDKLHALLRALDGHHRHIHGIKTHRGDRENRGRRRLLDPGKLPAIQAKLAAPGVTATEVAKELGVARSTLFNFLERFDGERSGSIRDKKAVKGHANSARDDVHVLEREATEVAADDSLNASDR